MTRGAVYKCVHVKIVKKVLVQSIVWDNSGLLFVSVVIVTQ